MLPGPGSRAVAFGGGGVTGIAWLTGLLVGLEERGFELGSVSRFVGTSAGATVAAQVTSGLPLSELFDRQVDPEKQVAELEPDIRLGPIVRGIVPMLVAGRNTERLRRRAGRMALKAETVDASVRREVIAARLPRHEWPDAGLVIVAVDALSGEARAFERDSGVGLVDAVAASCAVPGVWPPVEIQGRPYIDGGIPSLENTEFSAGCDRVLVLSPMGGGKSGLRRRLRRELRALEKAGSRVWVVTPDTQSRAAIGRQVLDPSKRGPAASAGRRQGHEAGAPIARAWL